MASSVAGEMKPSCPNSLRIFSVVWAALKNIAHELAIDSFVRFELRFPTDEPVYLYQVFRYSHFIVINLQGLFQIEHGICTNCQLDCHRLVKHLRVLSVEKREAYIKNVAPNIATHKKMYVVIRSKCFQKVLVKLLSQGQACLLT